MERVHEGTVEEVVIKVVSATIFVVFVKGYVVVEDVASVVAVEDAASVDVVFLEDVAVVYAEIVDCCINGGLERLGSE